MDIPKSELAVVLGQFNPWWRGEAFELPNWRRAPWHTFHHWVVNPPAPRAILLSGARQIGKTTLMMQSIQELLRSGVPPSNILYATFDHPLLKLAGIDAVLEAWRLREPRVAGTEYLFLDEAQFMRDWGAWIKHQVDFSRNRRIAFTGSAMPLLAAGQESGVGRWHTIRLATLSFFEYLQLKKAPVPPLPRLGSLDNLFDWTEGEFLATREAAAPYAGYFHDFLLRGGFPQTILVESIQEAQRLLRDDIVDKVLKRDMTALFGVRRVLEMEHTFLYLCMHGGSLLDMQTLCASLEVKRPTAQHFIELLEATNLIYRLQPFGYGKEVLRGRLKIHIADPAIAPAVMMKGKSLLDDPVALGIAAEGAVFRHLFGCYHPNGARFTYWRGRGDHEVDIVAELPGGPVPFEVKYRSQQPSRGRFKGLLEFCREKKVPRAWIVTQSMSDFSLLPEAPASAGISLMRIPAPLLCYWAGESEAGLGATAPAAMLE